MIITNKSPKANYGVSALNATLGSGACTAIIATTAAVALAILKTQGIRIIPDKNSFWVQLGPRGKAGIIASFIVYEWLLIFVVDLKINRKRTSNAPTSAPENQAASAKVQLMQEYTALFQESCKGMRSWLDKRTKKTQQVLDRRDNSHHDKNPDAFEEAQAEAVAYSQHSKTVYDGLLAQLDEAKHHFTNDPTISEGDRAALQRARVLAERIRQLNAD